MKQKFLLFNILFFISTTLFSQQWYPIGENDVDQLSPGQSDAVNLFSSNSALFGIFKDVYNSNKPVIKRLNATKKVWETFRTSTGLDNASIADAFFYGSENPKLVYLDPNSSNNRLIISSYSNNSWAEEVSYTAPATITNITALNVSETNAAVVFEESSKVYVKATNSLTNSIRTPWTGTSPRAIMLGSRIFVAYRDGTSLQVKTFLYNDDASMPIETHVATSSTLGNHQIMVANNDVYIAYTDNSNVIVKKFNGTSWIQINGTIGTGSVVSMSAVANTLYVAYKPSVNIIAVKRITPYSLEAVGTDHLPYNLGNDFKMKSFENKLYTVYRELGTIGRSLVKVLNGDNWESISSQTIKHGITDKISVSKVDGKIYVAYNDADNKRRGFVKMFNGTTWENIGGSFSSGEVVQSTVFATAHNVYVMYGDMDNLGKATVKKLKADKSGWELVGNAGFSDNAIELSALAVSDSKIYAAYKSNLSGYNGMAFVKTINLTGGTIWEKAGTTDYVTTTTNVRQMVLKLDNNKTPYIACGYQGAVSRVRKLVNNIWLDASEVQTNVSALYPVTSLDLAFDHENTPYIIYDKGDISTNNKVTVKKLVNNFWSLVGNDLVSEGTGSNVSITFIGGAPYVSYSNGLNNHKLNVKVLAEDGAWRQVGLPSFSAGGISQSYVDYFTGEKPYIFVIYNGLGSVYAKSLGLNTLPVSLTTFKATLSTSNRVSLSWKTASEKNNKYFNILKSRDGVTYQNLGKYGSKGNNSVYSATDNLPFLGVNYYKLQQTDLDGKISELGIETVNVKTLANKGFTVYPNPVKYGTVYLQLDNLNGKHEVKIYDLTGKLLSSEQLTFGSGKATLELNLALTRGLYLLKVAEKIVKLQVN